MARKGVRQDTTSVHISRALSSSTCPHTREPRFRWKQKRRKRLVSGECRLGRSGRCLPGHARILLAEEPFLQRTRTDHLPRRNEFDASFFEWLTSKINNLRALKIADRPSSMKIEYTGECLLREYAFVGL